MRYRDSYRSDLFLLRANSIPVPKQDLQELNSQFMDLLKGEDPELGCLPRDKAMVGSKSGKGTG